LGLHVVNGHPGVQQGRIYWCLATDFEDLTGVPEAPERGGLRDPV